MSARKFDVVLMGEEPGGIWLASQLANARLSVGQIRFSRDKSYPTLLSERLASHYHITTEKPFCLEIVTPSGHLDWSQTELSARYPALFVPPGKFSTSLRRYPELLGLCEGIWKRLGRVESLEPVTYLSALELGSFVQWKMDNLDAVTGLCLNDPTELSSIDFLERGEFQIRAQGEVWDSKHLVIALDLAQLTALNKPQILHWLGSPRFSYRAGLVPVSIEVRQDFIPRVLRPTTIVFDETAIPDPDTEICAFDYHTSGITLWVSIPWPIDMPLLEKRLERLLTILERHMPFFKSGILSKTIDESGFIPQFAHARLHNYRTRHKHLSWIAPDHFCQLLYPEGSLRVAEELHRHLLGKRVAAALLQRGSVARV